jgi:hypothetical protein
LHAFSPDSLIVEAVSCSIRKTNTKKAGAFHARFFAFDAEKITSA